jgi:hypothetical protein
MIARLDGVVIMLKMYHLLNNAIFYENGNITISQKYTLSYAVQLPNVFWRMRDNVEIIYIFFLPIISSNWCISA